MSQQPLYRNPLEIIDAGGRRLDITLPDPYVMKYNGTYYAYATGHSGVPVLRSGDGVSWTYAGHCFSHPGLVGYWAPAVVYENGLFYLYVSAMPEHEEDVHEQRLMVASSPSPVGPFEYGATFFTTFSIDAHVVKDRNGAYYLFYSNNEYAGTDGSRPGTVILVDRLIDMQTLEGKPKLVVAPTLDEEIFEENRFGDGRDWHTIEGAFYLRRGNTHYVMYSGNAYVRPNYFLGYSSAAGSAETALTDLVWRKHPADDSFAPLLRRNEGVEGVGHNSVVRGPNNVQQWVYYHGRNAADVLDFSREQRTMRMDPLLWDGEELWVPGPSYTEREAPFRPAFADRFAGNGPMSPDWEVLSGDWRETGEAVCQAERTNVCGAVAKPVFGSYVLEAGLAWHPDHRGGLYGLYLSYTDRLNHVVLLLDAGRRLLLAYAVRNGVKQGEISAGLPPTFRFDAYHHLRVEKSGNRYVILLDDVERLSGLFPFVSGRVGFVTLYSSASFAGLEVTEHLALTSSSADGFAPFVSLQEGGGIAEVREGELVCRTPKARSAWLLDLSSMSGGGYCFAFDVKLDARAAYAGGYAVYRDPQHYVEVRLSRVSNRIEVLEAAGGEPQLLAESALPADFDWRAWHTVQAAFRSGALEVVAGRSTIVNGTVRISAGAPGMVCSGNAVFRFVGVTGIQ